MASDQTIDIPHLMGLCRISLSEEEQEVIKTNLDKMLSYLSQIDEVDVEGILPCTHVLETIVNVMEDDEEGPLLAHDTFLNNAPDQVGGMIRVPPVIQFEE